MKTFPNINYLAIALAAFAYFTLSPTVRAVDPPPDGGYPGSNTAEGDRALLDLTSGVYNTAVGWLSLEKNTEGNFNTAIGAAALLFNTAASENTATGAGALLKNAPPFFVGGNGNTANGAFALIQNSSGSFNSAIGDRALFNNISGSNNIALGGSAGTGVTTASNVICIGAGGNNQGNSCFIGQIFGASAANAAGVYINASGKLVAPSSSRRFKEDIKPMEQASEVLFGLKPVTFRYKKEIDPEAIRQFGLVAEEVEALNPDLVVRDKEGKTYSVRYDQVNAMLLNEFLKEHRKLERLTKDFESKLAEQQRQIEALTKGLQKVSAQLEARKAAPQVVNNP